MLLIGSLKQELPGTEPTPTLRASCSQKSTSLCPFLSYGEISASTKYVPSGSVKGMPMLRMPSVKIDVYKRQVYSEVNGSAAAPTAGLHFTPELLKTIQKNGVNIGYVTLHVGLGTCLLYTSAVSCRAAQRRSMRRIFLFCVTACANL